MIARVSHQLALHSKAESIHDSKFLMYGKGKGREKGDSERQIDRQTVLEGEEAETERDQDGVTRENTFAYAHTISLAQIKLKN